MNRNIDDLFFLSNDLMDEESRDVAALVRQWADREVISKRMEYREKYGTLFLKKRKKLCLDIGLQKLVIPSELGGFGWNSFPYAPAILAVSMEIGRADAGASVLQKSAKILIYYRKGI